MGAEVPRVRQWLKAGLLLFGAALCLGCEDTLPTVVEPIPSPSPSPTPVPVDVCDVLRTDIFAEWKGDNVFAWPLGQVPTLTARPRYRGEGSATADELSECLDFVIVHWSLPAGASGPPADFQGNINSPTVRLQVYASGTILVRAVAQGYEQVPGEALFKVQASDLGTVLPLDHFK